MLSTISSKKEDVELIFYENQWTVKNNDYKIFFHKKKENKSFSEVPLHWHEDLEISYIKKAKEVEMLVLDNDKHYVAQEGDVFSIPSNHAHSIKFQNKDSSIYVVSILFSDNYLNNCLDNYRKLEIKLSTRITLTTIQQKKLEEIKQLFDQLITTHELPVEINIVLKQKIIVNQILYLLITYFSIMLESKDIGTNLEDIVLFINEYIIKNVAQSHLINSLSKEMNISSAHLSRIYKKGAGRTLSKQINETRLYLAYEILSKNRYSINYISDVCGFSNPSYFIRKFKEKFGETPKKFVQQDNQKLLK